MMSFPRKIAALFLLVFTCSCALPAASAAANVSGNDRIYDYANLFSGSEKQQLEEAIVQFQKDTGMDFVVLTSRQAHEDVSQQSIADDFYDSGNFGLDEEHSGVLYYIDMDERWHWLSTTGAMIDYMTDERIDSAIDACTPSLSSGSYAAAVNTMLGKARGYIRAGIPEGQYRYDVVTGQRLTARHKALTSAEMLMSAVIALVVGMVFVLIVRRRYQLKGSTYQYQYRQNCDMTMTDSDDTFLRTTTTQVRKPDPPQGGGNHGGFGGGGGSGVHSGGGGTSHGGGGGRF